MLPEHMTDWHSHLLPGLDDGAATVEEALEMALILSKAGFRQVCCTPHCIRGSYDATGGQVRAAVHSLQGELDAAGIDIRLRPGREHYLDEFLPDYLGTDPLTLGDSRYFLLEIPSTQDPEYVKQACYRIRIKGFIPVIAHPERCSLLSPPRPKPVQGSGFKVQNSRFGRLLRRLTGSNRQRPASASDASPLAPHTSPLLDYLVEVGAQFQGNIGSLAGIYGEAPERRSRRYLAAGLYTLYGSDAHSPLTLETWLGEGLALLPGAEES